MSWRPRRFRYQCVFAMVAAAMVISPAQAQNIRRIQLATVKPDRVGDFLAAVKESAALEKKGGSERFFSVWHSLTGANEYVLARNYAKWADLDAGPEPKMKDLAAQLQAIGTRITQCIETSHMIVDEVLLDLSLPQTGPISMIRVLRSRVKPDKVNEYTALLKSEMLPAMKKAGLKLFAVSQVRYGGPNTEFISVSGINSWADLDGGLPIQKAMGEEGYQRFLAKLRPLIIESEANVFRFVPDSSYSPN
jgi:hypothetical protein